MPGTSRQANGSSVVPLPDSEIELLTALRDQALSSTELDGAGSDPGLTQAELEQRTGMSRPSVTNLIRHFAGVLQDQPRDGARGGRIAIDPRAGSVIGVDIGQAHVTVAVADLFGRIYRADRPESFELLGAAEVEDADATLDWVVSAIGQRLAELEIQSSDVAGVGISIAGPVDPDLGVLRQGVALGASSNVRSDWELFDARDHLRRRLGWDQVPFLIDNDANVAALAEYVWGAAAQSPADDRTYRDVIYVEWSEGIGAGLLLGGEVFRGSGVAGEMGHVIVQNDGVECPCGLRGCLNAVGGWRTLGAEIEGVDDIRDALDRAHAGEPAAQRAFKTAAGHLATALGPLISVLNPQMVVIGGAVGRGGYDLVRSELLQGLKRSTMRPALRDAKIVGAKLGGRTSLQGAVALVLRPPRSEADALVGFLQRKASQVRNAPAVG